VVFCPEAVIARRYRTLFESDGVSLLLRPFIFTPADVPLIVDMDQARAKPTLAVLSAICHGSETGVDAMFPALLEALRALGPKQAILYYDIVLVGLPVAPRARWEAFMTTTVGSAYRSELLQTLAAEHEQIGEARGEARGEALGEARAVLTVLQARGVDVPADICDRILACTDLDQLDTWLRRAGTATTVDDVIG